jgi:hypothetical protein
MLSSVGVIMFHRSILALGALLLVPTGASAQTVSVSARATAAIMVPSAAIELRAAGVPAPEVRAAIVEVRTARIPAPEVRMVLVRSRTVVELHGPIPDYGAFVGVKIRGGFRGPRLYEVIEVEHRRRGHPGRGFMKGHYRDHRGPPGQVRMGRMGVGGVIVRPGHRMGRHMGRRRGPGPHPRAGFRAGMPQMRRGRGGRMGGGRMGGGRMGGRGRGGRMGGGRMGGGRMR